VSEDGSAVYFSGVGKGGATDFLKVPIAFQAGEWWVVTVCYSPSNSALWLNDQLVAEGEGVATATHGDSSSFGLVIGSDIGAANPAEAQFDDLTVFDYWPSEKQQAAYYKAVKKRAILGPVGTEEEEQAKQELVQTMMESEGPPPVPGEGGGGEGEGGVSACGAYDYPSNMLWLEITGVSNNLAYLIVHGTVEDVPYEILSKVDLTNIVWASEGIIIGAAGQNWTPTTVIVGTRTNSLFLWARSWADSDGDGLPDWYEDEVTGTDPNNPDTGDTGVSDGYKDADNDGWTNLQEYQNGTNPNAFNTPAAPDGLVVTLVSTGLHANLTWQPARGAVTGYTIERSFTNVSTQVSSSLTSYADNSHTLPTGLYFTVPKYRLQANYSAGNSAWGPWTSSPQSIAPEGSILSGSGGQVLVLAPMSPSPQVDALRGGQWYTGFPEYSITNVDLPVTAFTNGIATMPEPFATLTSTGYWYLQWVHTNGVVSAAISVGWAPTIPFWDGRQQLKQNLRFLLRAATINDSFRYKYDDGEFAPSFVGSPANYAYAGLYETYDYYLFWGPPDNVPDVRFERFRPFEENHRYRNFAFSATNLHTFGDLTTGIYWDSSDTVTLDYPPVHLFSPPANPQTIPALLGSTESQWLYWTEFVPLTDYVFIGGWDEMGISYQSPNFVMATGARNIFGLTYQSVKQAWGNNAGYTSTLNAGGSTTAQDGFFYPGAAQPILQTAGYYFGRPWVDWLPGHTAFSPTNTTPLLITSVGQPLQIAGYAKLAVTNGYPGTYGFLGQYFDKAYTVGTNGMATTNLAGLLSPYGDFFPTEPGPSALVTLPDLETGERGTCTVHVIKIQLDVNHDGVMDLSFGGPDNTSQARPFRFWVNNDYDRAPDGAVHGEEDDLASSDSDADSPDTGKPAPDSEYRRSDRNIPSLRDLEDFARLWISGITTNLYPALPAGVVAELSWGDKGSPNPNNPTIDIFGTPETDGGIGYLTNFLTGIAQTNSSWYGDRLGPGDSISVVFSNSAGWQHWSRAIWCGVKKGSGKLTLTFSQGTNTIAETSTYIEVKDIKEMYERWTVGDIPQMAPTNKAYLAVEDLPGGAPPFQYTPPTDTNTPYILLVHDYDLSAWKKDRYAETAFKRLYWQGYEGRFGLFRWPGVQNSSRPLDDSEFNAWRSGAGLRNLLTDLHSQYPGKVYLMAHGYGAVAAGEALRLAGTNYLVNTYIAMQGAVAAHAYDPSAPLRRPPPFTTPDFYSFYHTNNAPYFWPFGGAGAYINYFNTNDIVLIDDWRNTQETKPDFGYHWNGTNFSSGIIPPYLLLLFPADRYEIFAYCDEARSEAAGAQQNLSGPFNVSRQLDISTLYSPSGILFGDHDAQFKSYCADTWLFWREVLGTRGFGLKP